MDPLHTTPDRDQMDTVRALRLSYDHKGSDENEGKCISNAKSL